jgi:thiamine pyrophosphate-dependent acetolactate synthase large subunit-like protein
MSKKVSQGIVEVLESAGVEHCYGIVGDTLNTFATRLSRSRIRFPGAFAAQGEALPIYTDLKTPDFGQVAQAMGLWGRTVTTADDPEAAVDEWLAQPGPALLNVKVAPMELVMQPFTAFEPAYGMAMYSVKALLHGQAGDVFEMIGDNLPK